MTVSVTVLGCGGSAGVPMIGSQFGCEGGYWGACDPKNPKNERTRSSILVEKDGYRILVDPGPDMRTQLLRAKIARVDAIFCTHAHSDHIAGLDDLRAVNRNTERSLPLYADSETIEALKARCDYVFWESDNGRFPRASLLDRVLETYRDYEIGPFKIRLFEQTHGRTKSHGIKFDDFAYCTDVSFFPARSLEELSGVNTLLVGCFQPAKHFAHAGLEDVLEWREKAGVKETYLTHMGTEMDYDTLKSTLPADIIPGYDGLCFTVP